jgi:exonuclease 3'-5' domain-containing protein 1|mmetsp:Transcript_2473/g.8874  ORF Transcript_2473/g.8874 Transcript_2473/m.8874 type:complete len:421 (+) Transcript_2473:2016-3278(+)
MGKKRKLICSNCQAPFKKTTETISMIMSASIPSSFVAAAPPSSSPSSSSSVLCKACSRSRIGESVGGSLVPKTSTQSGGFVATMQTTTSNNNNNINNNRFAALASSALPNYRVEASLEDEEANNNDNGIKRSTKKKKKKKKGGEQNKGNTNALKMNVMKDAECREILDELDEQVVFIDSYTSEAFTQCVLELKRAKVIAYDCEGVRLSRTGKITLLQIAIPKKIFLIDVMTIGGKEVFIDGGLKDIIESEEILKLAYDVRMDSDALFHQHDVVLKNVLDLQLLDIAIRRAAGGIVEHLPSLSKTVSRRLTNAEILVCEDLKKRVKNMYTSVEDGDLWARRPLIDDARRYAALDAWVLMKLDQAMRPNGTTAPHLFPGFDEKWNERVLNASRKRIDEYKDKEIPIEQGGKRTAEMTQAPPF